MNQYQFTGKLIPFDDKTLLVSKTNTKGVVTYANRDFFIVSKFPEQDFIGKPHAVIRHEFMPRAVFRLMWDTIQDGKEFFGFVVNRCYDEDYYWVFAHVTADTNPETGEIIGYHSSRKSPRPEALQEISSLYQQLREIEMKYASKQEAIEASTAYLHSFLHEKNMTYEQFVFSIV